MPTAPLPETRPTRTARILGLLGLVLLIGLSGYARARVALDHPSFDPEHPQALLKSDPALLSYFTGRIRANGGLPPEDFRADPRVQWPELTDVPAEFTVGQEFLVAWGHLAVGGDLPLHVFALWLMAFVAALAAAGVYGVVSWRTRSPGWALVAATFWCVIPANYRTLGFVLVREDLSLPLFAAHLALLARASELRTASAFLWAGLIAGAACATWHAMGFFVAIELACLHLWLLRNGASPFEVPGSWAVLFGPVLAATLVPALRSGGFLLGFPMQLAFALLVVGLLRARGRLARRWPSAGVALGSWLLLLGVSRLFHPGNGYAHVFELLLAKVVHLGRRPMDPSVISFDARLLWQGPFETLPLSYLYAWIGLAGWAVAATAIALALRYRRELAGFDWLWISLTLLSLPIAWLVGRTIIVLGLLIPALVILVPARRRNTAALALFALLTVLQGVSFVRSLAYWDLESWYGTPITTREQRELLDWIADNVDPSEPIVSDFVTSAAILAHTGNPIVLQPKYETTRARRRAREFFDAYALGTAEDVRRVVRERFRSRLLVVDTRLGGLMEWTGGRSAERADRAAAATLGEHFEVLYSNSPDSVRGPRYHVYRVE